MIREWIIIFKKKSSTLKEFFSFTEPFSRGQSTESVAVMFLTCFESVVHSTGYICGKYDSQNCVLWIFWRRNHSIFVSVWVKDYALVHRCRTPCNRHKKGSNSNKPNPGFTWISIMISKRMYSFELIISALLWLASSKVRNFQNDLSRPVMLKRSSKLDWTRN